MNLQVSEQRLQHEEVWSNLGVIIVREKMLIRNINSCSKNSRKLVAAVMNRGGHSGYKSTLSHRAMGECELGNHYTLIYNRKIGNSALSLPSYMILGQTVESMFPLV